MIIQPGTYAKLTPDRASVEEIRVITAAVDADTTRIKPVTMTAKPAFNAATQRCVQNGWTINVSDVTPVWQVIAIPQAELDAATAEAADRAALDTIRNTINAMEAGSGTATVRTQRLETALAWLLKRLVKKEVIP